MKPIADRILSDGQVASLTVPVTDVDLGERLIFSLDPGVSTAASIDPDSGLFRWNGTSIAGVYPVTIRATAANVPTLSQTMSFHVSVMATDGSLPLLGTHGDDMVTVYDDRVEINGTTVDTTDVRTIQIFTGAGNDQVRIIANGALGPRRIAVSDSEGNDTYAFKASMVQVSIEDTSGIDALDFSEMDSGADLYLEYDRGEPLTIGTSGVVLGLIGTIENVWGSPFSDFIHGNSANNAIYAGAGDDVVLGAEGDDVLLGQDGNDRLLGDQGTDLLLGGSGRDFLLGGDDADILEGGGDNDILDGQDSRDVLIGGTGSDRLLGSGHDDLLIGGQTRFDNMDLTLRTILSEWTSERPYEQRTANLRGDGSSASFADRQNENDFLIANVSVLDDGQVDFLDGQSGRDWYFAHLGLRATDVVLGRDRAEDVDVVAENVPPPHETRLAGDSNHDGVFDSRDLILVLQAGKYEDHIDENATFEEGDWNQDGDFDSSDLAFAFQAGQYEAAAKPLERRIAAAIDRLFTDDDHAKKSPAFVA